MKKTKNKQEKFEKIWIAIFILIILIMSIIIAKIVSRANDKNYEIEEVKEFSYFKLFENKKYGVIDKNGNILVPANYDAIEIPNPSKPIFVGYINKNEHDSVVLNDKNEKVLTKYEGITAIMLKDALAEVPYEKSVLLYKENEKYGIIDFEGKKITSAIYDSIESVLYKEGCLIVKQNEKYGIINIKGTKITDIIYDSISADGYYDDETKYKNAGFIVGQKEKDGYKYGYIDNNGKILLNTEFNEIQRITDIAYDNGIYVMALKNGQAGIYKNSNQMIGHLFDSITYNKQDEIFIVKKLDKYGAFDKDGNELLKIEYDSIVISQGSIIAKKDEIDYWFDKNGNKKEQGQQNYIFVENTDYNITIDKEGLYGLKNKEGNIVLEDDYSYIEYAYKNYFIIIKDEKASVYDAYNRQIVVTDYNAIQKVENKNMLQAIIGNNFAIEIFNENMQKVYSMEEATLTNYENFIKLSSKKERKYFDKNGNLIENTKIFTKNELFAFENEGKWGFKDKNENVKVNAIYEMVTELNEFGFAGIKQDGKWGVINSKGKIIIEPTYELKAIEPEFIGKYYKQNLGYGIVYYTNDIENEQ